MTESNTRDLAALAVTTMYCHLDLAKKRELCLTLAVQALHNTHSNWDAESITKKAIEISDGFMAYLVNRPVEELRASIGATNA